MVTTEAIEYPLNERISFEEIYLRYYKKVFRLCYRMLTNIADAEEITQDVFVQVQRHWQTFRGEATVTSWLHRIAVNQVYMHWRKRSVRYETTTAQELPEEVLPAETSKMSNVDQIALTGAINSLPPKMRAVMILHDIYGYNHDEIGKLLGINCGTSKSQLHKARLKVREYLQI